MSRSIKQRNFVAKHMLKFNKATVEEDRKKKDKRGYAKHKKNWSDDSSSSFPKHCF